MRPRRALTKSQNNQILVALKKSKFNRFEPNSSIIYCSAREGGLEKLQAFIPRRLSPAHLSPPAHSPPPPQHHGKEPGCLKVPVQKQAILIIQTIVISAQPRLQA